MERAEEHREGSVARSIEQQTAKLPSDTFLWAALGSIGIDLTAFAVFSGAISLVRDTGPRPMSLAILVAISLSAVCLYLVALPKGGQGEGQPA